MKEQQYNEMCSFLANDEVALRKFIKFHNHYNDFTNYETIFEQEYGEIYRVFKGMQKPSVCSEINTEKQGEIPNNKFEHISLSNTQKMEFHQDIKIIRQWIQFIGLVIVISLVIAVIAGIVILSAS